MKLDFHWLSDELLSALVTGGAQGLVVITLVWLALKCFPRANAATRHGAWFATLVVVALLPLAVLAGAIGEKLQLVPFSPQTRPPLPPENAIQFEPSIALDEPVFESVNGSETPIRSEAEANLNWAVTLPKNVSLGLALFWAALATIRLALLVAQLCYLRRLKAEAHEPPADLSAGFFSIALSMGLSRNPRLLISEDAGAPMVVGFLRPAMLLPKSIAEQINAKQLEHLFRHELAHLARRDDWTNLLQQAIAAVLFFHPGILFLSRRLTAEREIACDDHALAISSAPREYALFLTEFASQMKGRDLTATPAAWSRKSQLKERIGMILNGKRNASPRVSRAGVGAVTAAALGLAIAALIASPRLIVAADEQPAEPVIAAAPAAALPADPALELAVASAPVAPTMTLTAPRTKISQPRINVNVDVQPVQPPQVWTSASSRLVAAGPSPLPTPEPSPRQRIKVSSKVNEDDADLEHRLDRLERMVEDLLKRTKDGSHKPAANFKNVPQDNVHAHIRKEIERAHREADRARREVEHVMREQKQIARGQSQIAVEHERTAKLAGRDSLKVRRQALEANRKQIEKELEAIEKEMEREEAVREKRNKPEEKEDKKSRDTDKADSDDNDFKPKK